MTLGFYFNQSACSGCRACQTACKDRNNLMVGQLYRKVTTYQTGSYPNASVYHFAATCNHCENPACVANCPTGAMYKDSETGLVLHNDDACIGCSTCVNSCPYQVPILLEDKGIANKCDGCKGFVDAGMNPVCVDACNMRCVDFGELDDLRAKYGDDLVTAIPCHADGGTEPNTLITPKEAALQESFSEVLW
ncbi:4Fe-4S dicluster domain-containing protein [Slackia heliotrinireducens]|uniref:4Fe-4S dicluster domain-containing protein n=1 Tax=Slackia heliotrinireducens TaxID=84110 RepID=UPI0033160BFC